MARKAKPLPPGPSKNPYARTAKEAAKIRAASKQPKPRKTRPRKWQGYKAQSLIAQARSVTQARKRRERERQRKRLAVERVRAWQNGDMHAFLRLHMITPSRKLADPSAPVKVFVAAERQSKVPGVRWNKHTQRWDVAFTFDGVRKVLGSFKTQASAEHAGLQARKLLGLPIYEKKPRKARYYPKMIQLSLPLTAEPEPVDE